MPVFDLPAPAVPAADPSAAAAYEQTHVHTVYESIASHFSATRYKPWPLVSWFLQSRTAGSIGLDLGCGNGKYIGVNPHVVILGSDRSASLISLAAGKIRADRVAGGDVCVADGLAVPYASGMADFAISIAVVHHFSTQERRRAALQAIMDTLKMESEGPDSAALQVPEDTAVGEVAEEKLGKSAGEALVYVWALEQGSSRRGWDQGVAQDQLVPWVTKATKPAGAPKKKKARKPKKGKGEKEEQDEAQKGEGGAGKGDEVEKSHEEEKKNRDETQEETKEEAKDDNKQQDKTVHRYYHLYRQGELEDDIRAVGGVVVRSGYERDNWWAIFRRA
ncbi:hypothetical protein TD95_001070 [Thielaviopsis punctulata]|uniref:Methyltransferase type 11 domain-containing protein n=1 Tax=Thielaviopsis punctulata TaxID=72032 RepID=A0A0F4Z8R8_9PEZI|nr:hypothetical protein TD95_001060 [Thielaviopsis punctulata]KKA26944.1 hypothetical protein TD95_001070 [Thielaviopsis punctulata]